MLKSYYNCPFIKIIWFIKILIILVVIFPSSFLLLLQLQTNPKYFPPILIVLSSYKNAVSKITKVMRKLVRQITVLWVNVCNLRGQLMYSLFLLPTFGHHLVTPQNEECATVWKLMPCAEWYTQLSTEN